MATVFLCLKTFAARQWPAQPKTRWKSSLEKTPHPLTNHPAIAYMRFSHRRRFNERPLVGSKQSKSRRHGNGSLCISFYEFQFQLMWIMKTEKIAMEKLQKALYWVIKQNRVRNKISFTSCSSMANQFVN